MAREISLNFSFSHDFFAKLSKFARRFYETVLLKIHDLDLYKDDYNANRMAEYVAKDTNCILTDALPFCNPTVFRTHHGYDAREHSNHQKHQHVMTLKHAHIIPIQTVCTVMQVFKAELKT